MKIVQNTLKKKKKISDIQKKFRVGPKKVGSVGFPETRHFFFFFFFFLPYSNFLSVWIFRSFTVLHKPMELLGWAGWFEP